MRAVWLKVLADRVDARTPDTAMLRVAELARARLDTLFSVDELARLAGLSRSRLTELKRAGSSGFLVAAGVC